MATIMTTEQKAKAYDEALEKAKKLYEQGTITESLSYVFPELKESEDEEVRQAIIDFFKSERKKDGIAVLHFGVNIEKMIAWLEKQGEQKPADMVEPKFKVGDWVVDEEDNYVYQVRRVISNVSNGSFSYDLTNNGYFYSTKTNCHLWTIADAKDGDVLCYEIKNELRIFIYKNGHIHYHCCYYNGHLTTVDSFFVVEKYLLCYIHPATKEQRDLLFQKIGEALYEWDAKEKELKKIEDEEYNGEDYGIDSLWHAKNILEKTLGEVDGYQSDDGILEHKCAITAVKKLYKQHPAWSAEDEFKVQRICKYLNEAKKYYADITEVRDCIDWLKSLKQRIGG